MIRFDCHHSQRESYTSATAMDTSAFENGGTTAAATVVPFDGLHNNNSQRNGSILHQNQNHHQHRKDAEGMNGVSAATPTVQTKIDGTSSSSSSDINGHHHSCDDGPTKVTNINGSVHQVGGMTTIQSNGNRSDHTNVCGSIDDGVCRNDRMTCADHDELKPLASVTAPPTPTSGTTTPSTTSTSTPIGLTIASDRVTYTDDAIIAKYTYVLLFSFDSFCPVVLPVLNILFFNVHESVVFTHTFYSDSSFFETLM